MKKVGYDKSGGNYIILEHRFEGKRLRETRYYHLFEVNVKEGDYVTKGQLIGLIGETGRMTTAKHLHFELREFDGKKWIYKNFLIGSTHNRKWMAGYYWKKIDDKWVVIAL